MFLTAHAPPRRRRRFFWTGGAPPPPTEIDRRAAADTMTSAHSSMMEESLHRKFNYFKADYDLVRLKMRGKDLERRTKNASVNESWNLLKKSLNEVIEETIP